MKSSRGSRAVALAVLVALAGCSKTPKLPPPVDVSGAVVDSNGRPLADMIVIFHADDELTGRGKSPSGVLSKDGKFSIAGVTPGRYKVTLAPIPVGAGQAANAGPLMSPGKSNHKIAVPAEYLNSNSTPWVITVESPPTSMKFVIESR